MRTLVPLPPWFLGPRRPVFYSCTCKTCGFRRIYEVCDGEEISLDTMEKDTDSFYTKVQTPPKTCPQCGEKLKKTKIPSPLRY